MNQEVETIFDKDEMIIPKVQKHWSREDILNQEGLFFFKDIAKTLMLEATAIKALVEACVARKGDPWTELGIKKVWSHWMVRMSIFAPIYRRQLEPRYQHVSKSWDGNTLLRQSGVFLLTDVCRKIPFTAGQLRHQVRQNPNAEKEYGIWKDSDLGVFLVCMERFAPWLQRLWSEGFREVGKTRSSAKLAKPPVGTRKPKAEQPTQPKSPKSKHKGGA